MQAAYPRQLLVQGAPGVALQPFQALGIGGGGVRRADRLAGLLAQRGFTLEVVSHALVRPGGRSMVAPGIHGGPARGLP